MRDAAEFRNFTGRYRFATSVAWLKTEFGLSLSPHSNRPHQSKHTHSLSPTITETPLPFMRTHLPGNSSLNRKYPAPPTSPVSARRPSTYMTPFACNPQTPNTKQQPQQ